MKNSIHVLIVEDEEMAMIRLKSLLLRIFDERNIRISTCDDLDESLKLINQEKIDLLLLDLNLNGENGFDILKRCVSHSFQTIIVSANREQALEAFQYGVFDFIDKPVLFSRFKESIQRFLSNQRSQNESRYLTIRKSSALELIPIERIHYIQAAQHYSELYFDETSFELHEKSLDKLMAILPSNFERVHRSYIVNMRFVRRFKSHSGSKYTVELLTGIEIPVGRTRYKEIKQELLKY